MENPAEKEALEPRNYDYDNDKSGKKEASHSHDQFGARFGRLHNRTGTSC